MAGTLLVLLGPRWLLLLLGKVELVLRRRLLLDTIMEGSRIMALCPAIELAFDPVLT